MSTTFPVQSTLAWLEAELPRYLEDLKQLVSIDSGTFDKHGTDAVASFLRAKYESLGGKTERLPHSTYGDIVIAQFSGHGSGRVLLLGHTDTVYPEGTCAARPFTQNGDKAFGPGSADMKAGDLSIAYAIEAIHAAGWLDYGRIEVLHNSDEEIGSPASRELIRRRSQEADAVLVLEAGRENGDIVWARKGIADIQVRVAGRSAHAGVNHDRGRSAVLEMARIVVALEEINGTIDGVTLNVGRLEGGERVNVVPDRASARLEVRAFEQKRLDEALARVTKIVETRIVEGTAAELEIEVAHSPMHPTEESTMLLECARELATKMGFDLHAAATGGASDGNTAAMAGRPVLDGLGPIGGGAHSPNEYIHVPSIVPRTALLAGLIAAVGGDAWRVGAKGL